MDFGDDGLYEVSILLINSKGCYCCVNDRMTGG
jgi:hypothetical protein